MPTFRNLRPEDVEAVARLEAEAFATPWSAATFHDLLRAGRSDLIVAELPHVPVAAYAVLWCFGEEGELANIAVAPGCRGRGLGSALLDTVLERARGRGVRELFLEVRESNATAISMYERRGFELLGRRRDYYQRPNEDALNMRLRL